jgi:two-component system, sensor histidine kinase PdtaS
MISAAARFFLLLQLCLLLLGPQPAASAPDTLRVDSLNELARTYFADSLVYAEQLSAQALNQAKELGYLRGIVQALRFQGVAAYTKGHLNEALSRYEEAQSYIRGKPGWDKEQAGLLLNMGLVHYREGNLGKALESYLEAEPLYAKVGERAEQTKLLNNLAAVYRQLERYEEAIRIYEKAFQLKKSLPDSLGMANVCVNIGLAYSYQQQYEKALEYLQMGKSIFLSIGEDREALSVHVSLGNALHKLGRNTEALQVLEELQGQELSGIQPYELYSSKLLLASLYLELQAPRKTLALLEQIEPALQATSFLPLRQSLYQLKASALYSQQDFQAAFLALETHNRYRDSLQSEERIKLEKEMEARYLSREKENLIQIQNLQLQKNQRERLILLAALLGLLLVLVLGYRLFFIQKRNSRVLAEKNALVEKALAEREVLLKEIHHRVKNNLQIISSLLTLQSRQVADPRTLELLQEGRNRVNSMALIHKNLYQHDNLVGVQTQAYIDKLTDSLVRNYHVNPQRIAIAKNIDPLLLDVDTIIPLGLVLNELISNALKYAFDKEQEGKLYVALKRQGDGLELRVADNGKGLPPSFSLDTQRSLGFRLIKAFAQKLEAELIVESDRGTSITLHIPSLKPA